MSAAAARVASVESLTRDLTELGLRRGDTVLIRADVAHVGRVEGGLGPGLAAALRAAVGENGTLVGLAFTRTFPLLGLDRDYVFRPTTPTTGGALPRLLLRQPGALRSRHPTNSFVAVGPGAAWLLDGHDESATAFAPVGRLVEAGGRQLVFGCVESSPGFTTVHWAQHRLGLDRRSLLAGRLGVRYERDGRVFTFRRRDIGGCSRGFGRLYPAYREAGLLREGRVGQAEAIAIDAAPALELELDALGADPLQVLCADPFCLFCRGSWTWNKRDWPGFWWRSLGRRLGWLSASPENDPIGP